jgi:outer membrane lipoprotein carrier protein
LRETQADSFVPASMLVLRLLLLAAVVAPLAACDRTEPEAETPNPPVAVWTPDSTTATASADSGNAGARPPGEVALGGDPEARAGEPSSGAVAESPARSADGASSGAGTESPRTSASPPTADAPHQEGDAATRILLRAERAYDAVRTMQAEFVQDLAVPLLEATQRSRGTIFHRKPDRFLMRFSDPEGDMVVADGRHLWLYYPSNDPGQVLRTSMGQAGRLDLQREFLSNPTERFNATLEGSEMVAGRPAQVLRLIPRGQSPYRQVRIWIDEQDALVRRFQITENNDAVRTVELRDLRVNATLPDDLFVFTPPTGVQVFDQ